MPAKQHVLHGRDHAPGGMDPIPGAGGGGIQFDTYPQEGGYLYASTTGFSPDQDYGIGFRSKDPDGHGIDLLSAHPGGASDEIQVGAMNSYGVGIGIYAHEGMQIFNEGGGLFQIRQTGGSGDDLRISTVGEDCDLHLSTTNLDADIELNAAQSLFGAASNGKVHFEAHDVGIIISDPTGTDQSITFFYDDGSGDVPILKVEVVLGAVSYHIQTGASWVADL